jgi:NTP pyrophosphatase (non-canonical NTP hydrolase)
MTLDEYQQHALKTATADREFEFFHRVFGLVGEAGEIAEKVKKLIRDKDGQPESLDAEDIKKELGDVLWYIATIADFMDISLDDVATTNVAKLADRQKRNQLHGSGDNR